ncbi:helix-turn-helix domain-containing protein [Micromonospora sp. CPCC 206061]|uniref:PucR family transcriptional regulator n=1 Tax=Micromonospora sp. CPCC 206061 TaxID=3122410 RepID=UPI002FF42C42
MRITVQTAQLLRADILESAGEMVSEIDAHVPEYADRDGALRVGVELALRRYVDLLDQQVRSNGSTTSRESGGRAVDWREVYRQVGAAEMRAGRSLDSLHAAVRICARVANRRLHLFAERHALPSDALAWLGEMIFDNIDDISAASAEGYAAAREAEAGELDRRRRHLLDLLVADPPPSARAVAAAAAAAHWRLPRRLAAVAIATPGPVLRPPVLPPQILSGFHHIRPCLIAPEPQSPAQARTLVNGLAGHQAAVGLPVSPVDADRSLRWARLALDLTVKGRLPRQDVVWCADHLTDLVILQDQALTAALVERRLAPLANLPEDKRERLADTLQAWLKLNMNANEVATYLHLHPQTVRQRLRQLTPLFRDQIRDPEQRFHLAIALRARQTRTRPPATPKVVGVEE